jgi:predicted RecB family nuclease
MKMEAVGLRLSASDLGNHLGCQRITALDVKAARGELFSPSYVDPALEVLQERGFQHEREYLDHLSDQGIDIVSLESFHPQPTLDAMASGVGAIAQATLASGRWFGRADVLLKKATPSALGEWSYEVVDTKLSANTRASTILQLCMYTSLVGEIQELTPQSMHVVVPGNGFKPESYRFDEYGAYFRFVQGRLDRSVTGFSCGDAPPYPDPVEQCDICRWWKICEGQWRDDDHLSFVADISRAQRVELKERDVNTLQDLAVIPLPIEWRPKRGSIAALAKIREQARIQLEARQTEQSVYELLPLEPGRGLASLPCPSKGDIFFDIEGDAFIGLHGMEYLLGWSELDDSGELSYANIWSLDEVAEKKAFETFIDHVMDQWRVYPAMHVYHFHHYEPSALKRLMGRYATREDEVDQMLRAGLFVDLHRVTRESLRAGIERYSIKDLEQFYGLEREADLRDAGRDRHALQRMLELGQLPLPEELIDTVQVYNRDDCVSTLWLRDWLEKLREKRVASGDEIDRPALTDIEPVIDLSERVERLRTLSDSLLANVPADSSDRSLEQSARWLVGNMIEYFRREEKVPWWEYFRLADLASEDLTDDSAAISGLHHVERFQDSKKLPVDRYRFSSQEVDIRLGAQLHTALDPTDHDDQSAEKAIRIGTVDAIDSVLGTLDIKKTKKSADLHPETVFESSMVSGLELESSICRLAEWVIANGMEGSGPFRSGRDLLLRNSPRIRGRFDNSVPLVLPNESANEAAKRLVTRLDSTVIPIQGPPGSGKTYTGAQMILELIKAGKKVGITAVSHKAIRNLIDAVIDEAASQSHEVNIAQKVATKSEEEVPKALTEMAGNAAVRTSIQGDEFQVAAGTAWLWSREEMSEVVDVLFIDEAGQMSLANVLAVSAGAKSLVLLGDPQQLSQPQQGTHPEGVGSSGLEYLLQGEKTISKEAGLFLDTTWRMAPSITEFTSELFYDGRLGSRAGLDRQRLVNAGEFTGSGLWFAPVNHSGNQNHSIEEVECVAEIYSALLDGKALWVNRDGDEKALTHADVLVIAPYNAQVNRISERLPWANVGTVDRFQGQEAPVVIYSMATSTPEDAPRGMEFLYSLNRLNVATSRARCASILVANQALLEPDCKTPGQIKLANAFCRYRELSEQQRNVQV